MISYLSYVFYTCIYFLLRQRDSFIPAHRLTFTYPHCSLPRDHLEQQVLHPARQKTRQQRQDFLLCADLTRTGCREFLQSKLPKAPLQCQARASPQAAIRDP